MKRKILLLFFICSIFLIFSCTKNAIKYNIEKEKIMLDIFVDFMDDEIQKTIFAEAIEQFEIVYPNVVLHPTFDSGASYKNRLMKMSEKDTLPDIMYLWAGKENDFLKKKDRIKNMSDMFKPYQNDFLDVVMQQFIESDSLYTVPDYINTPIVVYANTSLLEKMGLMPATTYEELIIQGKIIREYGYTPMLMDTEHSYESRMSLLSLLLLRFHGASWIFEDEYQWDPNTETLIQTMEHLNALYNSVLFPRKNEIYNREEALRKFTEGEGVYFIDTSIETKYTYFEPLDIKNKKIEVVLFPAFANQMYPTNMFPVIVGRGFGMKNYLEKPKEIAARNWILFYAGKQGVEIKQRYNISNISYKENFIRMRQDNILQATLHNFLNNDIYLHNVRMDLDNEKIKTLYQLINQMLEKTITPYEVIINFNILQHSDTLYN